MDYPFTVNDLSAQLSKSKQSIYQVFNRNRQFIRENSIRLNRKIYYNQSVFDFLSDYYAHGAPIEAPNKPIEAPAREDGGGEAAQKRIAALEAKIEALEAQCADLMKQNGALLLLLQQEKQEKMLLLPAPRKPLGDKLRDLFRKQKAQRRMFPLYRRMFPPYCPVLGENVSPFTVECFPHRKPKSKQFRHFSQS